MTRRPREVRLPEPDPDAVGELAKNTNRRLTKFRETLKLLRQQAAIDYVTDSKYRGVDWHYKRGDRKYSETVSSATFEAWAINDKWQSQREVFWEEIQQRVIEQWRDKILKQRFEEIEKLTEISNHLIKYLYPLKDQKTGEVIIDATTGLPKFPLDMPPMDRFVRMFIELDRQLMVKRGEATARTETISPGSQARAPLDPIAAGVSMPKEDLRALSRILLEREQPGLRELPGVDDSAARSTLLEEAAERVKKKEEDDGGKA